MEGGRSGRSSCTARSEARLQREEVGTETLYRLPKTYGSVDMLIVLRQSRACDHIDGHTNSKGWSDLLLEEATLATLLRDHSIGLYLVEQRLVFALTEVAYMTKGEPYSCGLLPRVVSVKDAEETLVLLPERLEGNERIHSRQSKEPSAGLCL